MEKPIRGWTLGELAELFDGELVGDATHVVTHAAPAGGGNALSLTFAGDEKYLALAESSDVGAVLVPRGMTSKKPFISVDSPKGAFGRFLAMCERTLPLATGIHETAVIDPRAHISPTASVGAYAVIERDAVVSDGCRIYAHCYVGENCHLGQNVVLYPNVVLYQDVRIGDRSIVHASTVIGADGFGYFWDGTNHQKIPQVGGVVISPDCEIGASTTIDRATAGDTVVGRGTKLDNLVHLGHNSTIGENTVVAAGAGISGSVTIGNRVTMGGMVGVGDHVNVGDDIQMGGRSATTASVSEPGIYAGFPLRPLMEERRITILMGRLPEMAKRIKDLERRLAELESKDQ